MSRVEANVASQSADMLRPTAHPGPERRQQDEAAEQVHAEKVAASGAPVGAEDLQAAAAELQQVIEVASGRNLSFNVNQETSDLYVEISDQASGEVIKQIPGEAVLALRERLQELVGFMVDETA